MSSSGWIYNYLPISLYLVLRLFPSFRFINDTSVGFLKPKGCPPVVWIFYLKKGIIGFLIADQSLCRYLLQFTILITQV